MAGWPSRAEGRLFTEQPSHNAHRQWGFPRDQERTDGRVDANANANVNAKSSTDPTQTTTTTTTHIHTPPGLPIVIDHNNQHRWCPKHLGHVTLDKVGLVFAGFDAHPRSLFAHCWLRPAPQRPQGPRFRFLSHSP